MNLNHSSFILIGIPGLERYHMWISLPWTAMYLITLLSNLTVLFIIRTEASLHQPMYMFLSMLLISNLVMSNASVPKMLLLFWFNLREISFEGCLFQMFLIHSSSIMTSGVLVAMAFDRYTAICHPLRYTAILTNQVISTIGLVAFLRGVLLMIPEPCFINRYPFCGRNMIVQTHCEHMAVAKLACADISLSNIYGLFVALFVMVLDLTFIATSYFMIIRTVFKLPSTGAHTAVNTCASHIGVILMAYIPAFFSFLTQRYHAQFAPHTQILVSNVYLVIPLMLNPIIYGIKTKQIRIKIQVFFNSSTSCRSHKTFPPSRLLSG